MFYYLNFNVITVYYQSATELSDTMKPGGGR